MQPSPKKQDQKCIANKNGNKSVKNIQHLKVTSSSNSQLDRKFNQSPLTAAVAQVKPEVDKSHNQNDSPVKNADMKKPFKCGQCLQV